MDRDVLVSNIENIFSIDNKNAIDVFLDIVEENCVPGYDMIKHDDEIYIIDREHCQYINWYKLTHIGRDLHTNMSDDEIIEFLNRLKRVYTKKEASSID